MYFEPMKVFKKFADEEGIEWNFNLRKLSKRLNKLHHEVWRDSWEDFDRWRKKDKAEFRERLLVILFKLNEALNDSSIGESGLSALIFLINREILPHVKKEK